MIGTDIGVEDEGEMDVGQAANLAILLATAAYAAGLDKVETTQSNPPLTSEEVAVYRAFLQPYTNGGPGIVNLGNRTTPLELTESDKKNCLKGIAFDSQSGRNAVLHPLDSRITEGTKAVLVDAQEQRSVVETNDPGNTIRNGKTIKDAVEAAFASGLLEVSEIAFDPAHRYAVMAFSFSCGALCGHGGVLVFEKAADKWQRAGRHCSSWIS